jgi:hypothetical protein
MAGSKLTALADLAGGQVPTDLAYVVDLSAGVNGSKKSTLNDLFATITKNITDGALRFQAFAAPSLSAAAQGAAYFDSTLNRLLLSENAGPFMPLGQNMYLDNNSNTTVANTTTETALLGAADDGSTKIITPALARVNRTFRLSFSGIFNTTGSPSLSVRLKLVGGVTVTLETYNANVTSTGTAWKLEIFATITAVGAGGTIIVQAGAFEYAAATAGAASWIGRNTTSAAAVDFSVNQTWELTVQWGTADPANSFTYRFGNIDIVR